MHFADNDVRLSDDPNLKYRDETDAYTTISTRGHFTPNPKMSSYNPSPRQPYNPPTLSSTEHVRPEDLSSDKSRGDVAGLRERVEDKSVPLSARSYELSPSRKRQSSSPRQSQGPLADKIGKGAENVAKETPAPGLHTKLVSYWHGNIFRAVIQRRGLGISPGYYEHGPKPLSKENRRNNYRTKGNP